MSGDDLSQSERDELAGIWFRWRAEMNTKNYAVADRLRLQLKEWGAMGKYLSKWHPVVESVEHRTARLDARARSQQPYTR